MTFTMACPNFKKGLKMVSGPLGVKNKLNNYFLIEHLFHKPNVIFFTISKMKKIGRFTSNLIKKIK
jgi:hypothetical protein